MASAEMQLVCKIIKTGELKKAVEWGLSAEDFLMLETKAIYTQLLGTYTAAESSGSVIGPRLAQEKFAQLNLNDVDDYVTLEHLCHEVRQRRIAKIQKEKCQQAIELADVDPLGALGVIQEAVGEVLRLDSGRNTDIDFSVGMQRVVDRIALLQSGVELGKFPWPWLPLQDETGGIQDDDFIVFYGRPKSMKSWVLCYLIAWAVEGAWIMDPTQHQPPRVLVYTKEMTPDNIYMRVAACLAGLPYGDLRMGRIDAQQMAFLMQWVEYAKGLAGQNRLVVLSAKDVAGRDTVTWLRSKIDKYAPQVVFVDGIYLMSPENPKIIKDNERVASISRAMRQMILDTKVPIIGTMQANRKAAQHGRAELDEIAFSDAISQDSTMAARVIKDKLSATISIVLGGSREFYLPGFRIHGIPATNFSFHSRLSESDILNATANDNPEDQKKAHSAAKKFGAKRAEEEKEFQKNYNKSLENL